MSFFNKPPRYRTFLLTVWEERYEDPNLPSAWRFRLEDPRTGQRQGLANLEALMAMIEQEIGDSDDEPSGKQRMQAC